MVLKDLAFYDKIMTKHIIFIKKEVLMKKLKENRVASFAVVLIVYILAAVMGVAVYQKLSLAWWLALLIADVAATIFVFIFSLVFKNASVYDPYWSVQPPVILVALAILHGVNWFGVLLLLAIGFWATRLTANWAYTFGNLTHQDWRYTMLSWRDSDVVGRGSVRALRGTERVVSRGRCGGKYDPVFGGQYSHG